MSKKIEPINYTEIEIWENAETAVNAAHNELVREEIRYKKSLYDKFGIWKKQNPNNPLASRKFPNDEYLQVISAFWNYFDKKYPDKTNLVEIEF